MVKIIFFFSFLDWINGDNHFFITQPFKINKGFFFLFWTGLMVKIIFFVPFFFLYFSYRIFFFWVMA